MQYPIIWLTGHSGSGKTTLANRIIKRFKDLKIAVINLDGDEMRKCITNELTLSKVDRAINNYKITELALILSNQMPVIVSVIAPMKGVRNRITKIVDPIWIYLDKPSLGKRTGHFYEKSDNYDLELNTDKLSEEKCEEKIFNKISKIISDEIEKGND